MTLKAAQTNAELNLNWRLLSTLGSNPSLKTLKLLIGANCARYMNKRRSNIHVFKGVADVFMPRAFL